MVNLFVANTDNAWFDFLSAEQNITEVNFWWPGELGFGAIQPGELLVFRLKSPRNKIGGFGVFSSYSLLPMQLAWDSFGRANGVLSFDKLRNAIADYRPGTIVGPMTNIGCTILVEPVFFPPDLWFDVPSSLAVTEAYGRQCAITDGKVLPALDAAHIKPFSEGGLHANSNGILLRKDIHSVFDAGYATVDEDYCFLVSKKVKEVFNNGEEYLRLDGKALRRPIRKSDWPNVDFLRWHKTYRFLS